MTDAITREDPEVLCPTDADLLRRATAQAALELRKSVSHRWCSRQWDSIADEAYGRGKTCLLTQAIEAARAEIREMEAGNLEALRRLRGEVGNG